ncbi:MAG: redoxin domain-containing protein [Lachnospiraceae bacterium]|nr:redoxin domain-containing protein [Lachnospiraceae bacterium]
MKKKIVAAFFSVALLASSLTGCGELGELVEDTGSEQTQEAIQEGLDTFSDALENLLDENEDVGEGETQNEESTETAETQAEDAGSVSEGESAADTENTDDTWPVDMSTYQIKVLSIGDPAPDFTATLTNGETFTLSDHKSDVVLINFWATWCGPCVGEMPELQQLSDEGIENFELICVNCGEETGIVDQFVEKNKFGMNIAYDADYAIGNYYPTQFIPYTLIIKDGIIYDMYDGVPSKGAYDTYKMVVERLLKN